MNQIRIDAIVALLMERIPPRNLGTIDDIRKYATEFVESNQKLFDTKLPSDDDIENEFPLYEERGIKMPGGHYEVFPSINYLNQAKQTGAKWIRDQLK